MPTLNNIIINCYQLHYLMYKKPPAMFIKTKWLMKFNIKICM